MSDKVDSKDNNKVSTTSRNTNYNNRKDSNDGNSMGNRNRILPILRKDNLLQRKRLCCSHRRRHRSNSRSCLLDNRTRFYNCRRSMSQCWYKLHRWCRSRFLFFRR